MSVRQKKYMGFILIFLLISVFVGSKVVKSLTEPNAIDANMSANTTTVRSKTTVVSSSDPSGCGGTATRSGSEVSINLGNCTSWTAVDNYSDCTPGRGWPSSGSATISGSSSGKIRPKRCCFNTPPSRPGRDYLDCCDHNFVVTFSGQTTTDDGDGLTGGISCVQGGTTGSGCVPLDEDIVFPPCSDAGESCSTNNDCCPGQGLRCQGGICSNCKTTGVSCTSNSECCSGYCIPYYNTCS